MNTSEREHISKSLAESRKRLVGITANLTSEQLQYREGPDRWSIAENLEHITLVEGRWVGVLGKTVQEPADPSKRSAMHGQDEAFAASVAERSARFQAPEPVRPTGRWKEDELLQKFEAARQSTNDFIEGTNADLRRYFVTHPRLGELDGYQILLLVSSHCNRHRAQIEEVMAAEGFPRAGGA